MANPRSILPEYTPFTPQIPVEMLLRTSLYKQGLFDANYQKIQAGINDIAALDVMKDEDRNYLNQRLEQTVASLNEIGSMDLSDPNVNAQVNSYTTGAIDDNIMNAVSSTSLARKLLKNINDFKEKHPDQYASANEWYDTRALQDWVSDGRVGSKYKGGTSVTPWTDVGAKMTELAESLKPSGYTLFEQDGQYHIITKDNEELTPQRVSQFLQSTLSEKDFNQLSIDGAYRYKDASPQMVANDLTNFYNNKEAEYLNNIARAQNKISNNPNDYNLQNTLNDEIAANKKALVELNLKKASIVNDVTNNKDGIAAMLQQNEVLDGFANSFSYQLIQEKIQSDDAALRLLSEQNENLRFQQRLNFDIQKHQDDLELEYYKNGVKRGLNGIEPNFVYNIKEPTLGLENANVTTAGQLNSQINTMAMTIAAEKAELLKTLPEGTNLDSYTAEQEKKLLLGTADPSYVAYKQQTEQLNNMYNILADLNRAADAAVLTDPEYQRLLMERQSIQNDPAIGNTILRNVTNFVLGPTVDPNPTTGRLKELDNQLLAIKNKYLESKGLADVFYGKGLVETEESKKAAIPIWKNIAINALTKAGEKAPDTKDLEVLEYIPAGRSIVYRDKTTGETQVVAVPTEIEVPKSLPGYSELDPEAVVKYAINSSPNKSTPPQYATTSFGSQIKYRVKRIYSSGNPKYDIVFINPRNNKEFKIPQSPAFEKIGDIRTFISRLQQDPKLYLDFLKEQINHTEK